ncbi:MAG: AgmX/PglI C-terminal domain-containing protein [Bdellovibrionales bacterium]|nr:AgmX/PglI C-terminal domain-containing protein [Bdellovibrionales bacterium]
MPANFELKVNAYWGDVLYDTAICGPTEAVTVGKSASDTFILDVPPKKIVEVQAGKTARLFFSDDSRGHVYKGKEVFSLAAARSSKYAVKETDGSYSVMLGDGDKADVVIGHMTFYFGWLDGKTLIEKEKAWAGRTARWVIGILLFVLLLGGALAWLGVEEEVPPPERLVLILPKADSQAGDKAAAGERKTEEGGAEKGEEGAQSAVAALRKSGLSSLVNKVTSIGGTAPAIREDAPTGAPGGSGLSTSGLKSGAGGKSQGIGRTTGQGEGGFAGTGKLGLSGNSLGEGTGSGTGAGRTRVTGGLDRDVIESVIRRRLDRVRLCYERQLNFDPKLKGKIAVHFRIGAKGEVLSADATEDTMKNAQVKGCLLAEVASWTFPAPEGGTVVNVDYPFFFESGGAR